MISAAQEPTCFRSVALLKGAMCHNDELSTQASPQLEQVSPAIVATQVMSLAETLMQAQCLARY